MIVCTFRCAAALILLFPVLLPANNFAQEISWIAPEDGGTPRDTNRIERIGPREFRVRAAYEEGGQRILRHAASRVDLLCKNTGRAGEIILHIDLSDDGKRTDFDNRPEAGMPLRDFVFVQRPGEEWKQINGRTERWETTVTFTVPAGDTKVGLSPWYTYGDLLNYIRALPGNPHLAKRMFGKSDGGREQWELTITDPGVAPETKRIIYWHAREHAYETWSSVAMEGLVTYLLSDEAADFRRRFVIVLHPMTNVDGVAEGFEYRAGYDFPQPRGSATGRLTFDTVDRLRPHYAVAWHNWIAPRDRNVVFYTDGEEGKPSARAWLRFTQLYPSLHAVGHRWKDETTPLRYNWFGRTPLSEWNVHQYAMKKYGTRVWGWEMPWWNYSVSDARQSGARFGRAFLTTISEIEDKPLRVTQSPPVAVPRWQMHELALTGRANVPNPFKDAALVGEFVSPSRRTNVVDGFHDGEDRWRLRFAPDEEGEWSYQLRGEGVEILQRGTLTCTAPQSRGFIRVHPKNPFAFAYSDGAAFLPMGDTCYGLLDDSPITPSLREEYLKVRRANGFNFVRMTVGHSEARAATNHAYWAWGGTAQKPDLDRFNPVFFQNLDALMHQLRGSGMNAELILLNFYRRPYTDTNIWTASRERQWLRYLVSRYSAFDNVFLWTIANEYETHPEGRYRLDFPSDVEWAKRTARWIKENDPCHHLVTVHPVVSASRKGSSPRDPIDPPWRIGEFFGDSPEIDVLSQQTGQVGEGTAWNEALQSWAGDSTTLVASVRADRRYGKPVLNSENGYEYLRGHPTEKKQVHHTDKVRRSAWRIVCAGGHIAAGFHGTIGHSDVWNRIDAPNHYTFTISDEGAAAQLGHLHRFFSSLAFWRLQPFDGVGGDVVALAEAGKTYVAYAPHGGQIALDIQAPAATLVGRWFNPRTGKNGEEFKVAAGRVEVTAPDTNDWALLVKSSSLDAAKTSD